MTDPRQVLDAVAFASRAHKAHFRKDGVTPYASHVFRVSLIVRDVFGFDDPRMLIAALLHDTVEDTTTDFDDIAERYGAEIATWVAYLTKDKRLPDERREEAYIAALRSAPWQVQACKLADVYDNVSDLQNLPTDKRARGLQRAAVYYDALREQAGAELQEPIRLVGRLMEQVRGELS
jgi:guanosine-3',5'-bis(diphosphate) 3'-pyrophosphohydrolase